MNAYLSVDLGTTGCRSSVFDENLNVLAYDYEEYGLITPKANYVEQDALKWWELTVKTAQTAVEKSGVSKCIRSISISSQGITVVPVDENLVPLSNALSWLDTRATEETNQIRKDFGDEEILSLTGKRIDAAYTLPKLLWMKKHMNEIFEKAHKFLLPMDFLIGKLTGNCVTDPTMASGTLMYDLDKGCWCKEILDKYSISEKKLPTVLYAGEKAGNILPEVAEKIGINKECIVAVGAQDQKCAAYAAGLDEKTVTVSLGTAAAITKIYEKGISDSLCCLGRCPYTEKDIFISESVINTAGTCLRWLRDTMFVSENYSVIDKEAEKAMEKESGILFFPYMNGCAAPLYNPESTGCFYGVNLSTKRGDFALAVMEGIAFQIRSLLESVGGYENLSTLVLFGGGANGELWPSVIASVTGLTVKIPESIQTASEGAAMLAAKALGADVMKIKYEREYVPDEKTKRYDLKYQKYKKTENALWGKEVETCDSN